MSVTVLSAKQTTIKFSLSRSSEALSTTAVHTSKTSNTNINSNYHEILIIRYFFRTLTTENLQNFLQSCQICAFSNKFKPVRWFYNLHYTQPQSEQMLTCFIQRIAKQRTTNRDNTRETDLKRCVYVCVTYS